jgi:hypothetical protein
MYKLQAGESVSIKQQFCTIVRKTPDGVQALTSPPTYQLVLVLARPEDAIDEPQP